MIEIRFIADNETDAHSLGKVVIEYSDGKMESFANVPRAKFFRWRKYGWLEDDQPAQVEMREELWEEDEPEEDEESELEKWQNIHLRPGVVTDDDFLGQITGIPSSGFEPKPKDE